MKDEKQIKSFIQTYREYLAREDNQASMKVLFDWESGAWEGHVMRGGYSQSDREKNGDATYDELNSAAQNRVMAYIKEACTRINAMYVNFGNTKLVVDDIHWYDFIGC